MLEYKHDQALGSIEMAKIELEIAQRLNKGEKEISSIKETLAEFDRRANAIRAIMLEEGKLK